MKSKKRIVIMPGHFFPDETSGGPAVSVMNMAKLLSDKYDIFIIASGKRFLDNSPLEVEKNNWILKDDYNIFYLKNYNIFKIQSLVREVKPSFIYLNSFYSLKWTFMPLIFFMKGNTKIIIAPRGNFSHKDVNKFSYKKSIYLVITKLIISKMDIRWHFTSSYEYNLTYPFLKNRLINDSSFIIENIHIAPPIKNTNIKVSNDIKILYFGRIHPKKNLKLAIDIVSEIKELKSYKFDIFGTIEKPEYFDTLKQSFNENITYLGPYSHENVHEILENYDVFLFLTQGENYGHTIAEALSSGLPVIISQHTPWSEIDQHGGYVVDIDNKQLCKSTIKKFYQMDHDEWKTMSQNAMSFINKKDLKQTALQYFELFD